MILTVDIGNTNITCGIYDNDRLVKSFRLSSDRDMSSDIYSELLKAEVLSYKIDGGIVGSVVKELDDRVICAVKNVCEIEPVIVSGEINMPINLSVRNPNEVGADRIANAVAAWNKYKKSAIVVDFGTATTFDVINSKGEFVGGIIAPGVKTQLLSLCNSTSLLDEYEIRPIDKSIGNDTETCILSGVIRGTASMIDGMLEQCKSELESTPIIIGTGGFVHTIATYMKHSFDYIDLNLTMDGLLNLYNLNKN